MKQSGIEVRNWPNAPAPDETTIRKMLGPERMTMVIVSLKNKL